MSCELRVEIKAAMAAEPEAVKTAAAEAAEAKESTEAAEVVEATVAAWT